MAYVCPVCEEPQVDAAHLANHVAFTAVIRGGDHESWLDDHTPGWDEDDEETLADRLLDLDEIEAVDHPIDESDDGGHEHGPGQNPSVEGRAVRGDHGALDVEAQEILDEAQELTRQMQASGDESTQSEGDTGPSEDASDQSEGETD